jgi:hypothetical protein
VDVGVALTLGVLAWIFVFGGLGAWVAAQKHRSVNEGFALGALFGVFGVLIEALLPNLAPPQFAPEPLTRKRRVEEEENLQPVNWNDVGKG